MRYFVLFLFVLSSRLSSAQKHEYGLSVGVTNYKGDFTNDNFEARNFRPALLLFYKNNITPAFGMRYHVMAGGISANDRKSSDAVYVARGMSFQNTIYEAAVLAEYNFLNYRSLSNKMRWSPYFTGGLGVFYFSPYSNFKGTSIQPCIPLGIGIKFQIKEHWNVGGEIVARKTFTDMLDNTSGEIPGGNKDTKDWYIYAGVVVSYTFYDVYCPKARR